MRIAVISTADRCGATVSTLLIARALADSQNRTVRLCYTGNNKAIRRYCGHEDIGDATCTISQVSKLLEAHAIAPEALGDYCTRLSPNMDIMHSWDDSLTEEEVTSLLTFTFTKSTTDYVFCDLMHSIEEPVTQAVLEVCDLVIIVSEPSKASLSLVREIQESEAWPKNKPCMLLVAKYHEEIDSIDNMAKEAQFRKRTTCKLHWSPFIVRQCNNKQLPDVVPYVLQKDPRVVELNTDLKECVQFILSLHNIKMKWEA